MTPAIHCLILEDDIAAQQQLTGILTAHFPQLHYTVVDSLTAAEERLSNDPFDVLLLDVNLPDGDAFELLERMYAKGITQLRIAFITAYSKHAVNAFKYAAIDFLLKPYLPEEMIALVNKLLTHLKNDQYQQQLETLFYNQQPQHTDKKIVLKTQHDIFIVKVTDIVQAASDNNYTRFYLQDERKILVSQPLKSFEKTLVPFGFYRVHQSHLINLSYLSAYSKKHQTVLLADTISVPVSQAKKSDLLAYLSKL